MWGFLLIQWILKRTFKWPKVYSVAHVTFLRLQLKFKLIFPELKISTIFILQKPSSSLLLHKHQLKLKEVSGFKSIMNDNKNINLQAGFIALTSSRTKIIVVSFSVELNGKLESIFNYGISNKFYFFSNLNFLFYVILYTFFICNRLDVNILV